MRNVSALAEICLISATPLVHVEARPAVRLADLREKGTSSGREAVIVAGRIVPSSPVDSVLVAGFVPTPGRASEADGEALAHALVRSLGDEGYPPSTAGMEAVHRARQTGCAPAHRPRWSAEGC